jgi:hypothetical protein
VWHPDEISLALPENLICDVGIPGHGVLGFGYRHHGRISSPWAVVDNRSLGRPERPGNFAVLVECLDQHEGLQRRRVELPRASV